nr:TetR family transcriptional regulator [Nocardia salmonicida]
MAAESAAAFGAHGYHSVSMDDIAKRLDISPTALYRHFPSKYALFREELFRLAGLMVRAAELPEDAEKWSPRERVDHFLDSMITMTITNRTTVGLARWDRRYLEPADYELFIAEFTASIRVLRVLIGQVRPELSGHDRAVRAVSIFALTSSIGDHHVSVPAQTLAALLRSACWAVIDADLTPPRICADETKPDADPQLFKHEQLLRAAVTLFHERGYPNVSMEDIAVAANLSAASAIYRYYRGKSDLLSSAFWLAADRVSTAITPAVLAADTPGEALGVLIDLYVRDSFAERALAFVYYAEFGHIDPADQIALRHLQQLIITEWAELVVGARPQLTMGEARILVHACFSLVVDLVRIFGDGGICPQEKVIRLLETVALGQPLPR